MDIQMLSDQQELICNSSVQTWDVVEDLLEAIDDRRMVRENQGNLC